MSELVILKQPEESSRFRYSGRGITHGCIYAKGSTKHLKKYPTVEIRNFSGRAVVELTLVQEKNYESPLPHPHKLTGKNIVDGKYVVELEPSNMQAKFDDIQIVRTRRKDYQELITIDCQNENPKDVKARVEKVMKSTDFSKLHLMFTATLYDFNGRCIDTLREISDAIVHEGDPLKICRMSLCAGSVIGREELFLICSKVKKDDIKVLFYELDNEETKVWEDEATFSFSDVYFQHNIVCKIPAYKNRFISSPVTVLIQMYRPSDESFSEAKEFRYLPYNPGFLESGNHRIGEKRKKSDIHSLSNQISSVKQQRLPHPAPLSCSDIPMEVNPIQKVYQSQNTVMENQEGCSSKQDRAFASSPHSAKQQCFLQNEPSGTPHITMDYNHMNQMYESQKKPSNVQEPCCSKEDKTFESSPHSAEKTAVLTEQSMNQHLASEATVDRQQSEILADLFSEIADLRPNQADSSLNINGSDVLPSPMDPPVPFVTQERGIPDSDSIDELLSDPKLFSVKRSDFGKLPDSWYSDIEEDGIEKLLLRLTIEDDANDSKKVCTSNNKKANVEITGKEGMSLSGEQASCSTSSVFKFLSKQSNEALAQMIRDAVIGKKTMKLINLVIWVKDLPDPYKIFDHQNQFGQTALQISSLIDNIEAASVLLKAGANPLIPDHKGNHAVHVACRCGNVLLLKCLIDSKHFFVPQADIKNHKSLSCFHLVVKSPSNKVQCMELLFEQQFNPNMTENKRGKTPLHFAVEKNDVESVQCLIELCLAKIDPLTFDAFTPLHLAVIGNHINAAGVLVKFGANQGIPVPDSDSKLIDLAQSKEMKALLASSISAECRCSPRPKVNHDLSSLPSEIIKSLGEMLNTKSNDSNWIALSKQLKLSALDPIFSERDDPTWALIRAYDAMSRGTMEGLIDGLMKIKRDDVVRMLDKDFPLS